MPSPAPKRGAQGGSAKPQLPDSLAGLIERVTFFNEENGFTVLRVKARGQRELVTVLGSLPSAAPGEWIHAEGRWVRDREFGLQFRADMLTSTAPTTREGIEKYLGSGMVKGIGPVYAKKLVARFGEKIFDIIDSQSGRLEEIEGIGPLRRRRIKEAWAEQKVIRDIMVFLHSHGVSTSRAVRIYKTYREAAIQRVRENPYVLARDIHGIGFKSADTIAQKLGVPLESLARASAGLDHVLQEASGEGHCGLPADLLMERACELLGVSPGIVRTALERSLAAGQVVREMVGDHTLIFLPPLQRAEVGIAAVLRRLCAGGVAYPAIDIPKAAAWCEAKTGKLLAPSQRVAIEQALSSRGLILTGGPGVGKTTLVNSILMILRAKGVRCALCAPTGRAAKRLTETTRLEAKTIHRLLQIHPGAQFSRNEGNPIECDLLVVDEMSMVDVTLMHQLLRALPAAASLLLVGDVDQLPSVGPGMVLRDIIHSGIIPVVRLTEVFRQACDSQIITTAHAVNRGIIPQTGDDSDADFFFVRREEPEAVAQLLGEMVQTRIPKKFGFDPVRDIQILCPMNRGSLGTRELNLRLQGLLNPARPAEPVVEKFGWQFRVRDKVIQTENDYDKDVFNGDIGQVESIDPEEREVVIRFESRSVRYDYGELDEVSLAYAITIHKAQGSEFPAVVIPIAVQQYMLLQRNLVYTGITRGKKLVVLIGQPKALAIAIRNDRVDQRYSGLLARLKNTAGGCPEKE